MTPWLAMLLLIMALIGIVLAYKYLSQNRAVQKICIIGCALTAIVCTFYIALTVLFVEAVSSRLPEP